MSVLRKSLFTLVLFALTGFALFSCNSPLFGLGGKVDNAVPNITVSTVDEGSGARTLINGDYVRGTIILRGTAADDISVTSVTLQFQEGTSPIVIPAALSDTGWSATINTTQYVDGPKDFIVTVKDSADKTTETRFVIYFDNKPPAVMFTLIGNTSDFSVNPLWGSITLKGSAADQFGIRKVRVYIHKKSGDGTGTLVYSSPDDATIGTSFFTITLNPAQYGSLGDVTQDDAYFSVQAFDRSGNESSWFYLSEQVSGLTIEDILALENGTVTSVNGVTLNILATKRLRGPNLGFTEPGLIKYFFDQSANLPIVTVSNPEQGKTAGENTISKNAKASGVVEDANGVALVELQFRDPGTSAESAWFKDDNPSVSGDDIDVSGTGRVVNWVSKTLFGNYPISGTPLSTQVYELRIRATDADGNVRTSAWVPFTIDADAPEIAISSPAAGEYRTGNPIVVSGTAASFGTANVSTVEVYIDASNGWKPATINTGAGTQNVTWSYNITPALYPTDGLFTVKARVTDTGTKQALFNIVFTVDRTAPSGLSISSPSSGTSVNGYKTFRGIANDNILLDSVYLVFEKNGEEILLDDTYSWSYNMDVNTLANTTYGYDMGNNIYRVPIRIKAVDKAGNITLTTSMGGNPASPAVGSYYVDADPDGDRPSITQVLAPGNFGNTYGTSYQIPGSIKVQGIASDDDAVHHVEMALMAIFDGTTERYCQQLTGNPGTITLTTTPTWITIDGASLWYKILNNNGELYDLASATGNPGGAHNGNFRIRLRAVDTKDNTTPDVTGNEVELYVRFDNTLPSVTGITPEENTVQRGTFNFQFTAQDNVQVTAAQISYNNGGSYTPIAITPAQSIPISININTTTINSGQFNNSAGTLNLRIKLTDDSNNISERNIKYLIDNILPTAALTTDVTDLNNKMIDYTTNLANILGTANDTGAVKGVSKVEVWFERSSVQIFPPSGHVVIDRNENYVDGAAGGAGEPDGYPESFTQNSGGWQWGFRFNSSTLTDGDITVHYLVFDEAGNSQEYTAPGAIKNNKPNISAIVLETDRNGDSDTTDDEERVRLERQTDINGEYTSTWKRFVLDGTGAKKDTGAVFNMTNSALTVMSSRFTARFEVASGNGTKYYYALAPNGTTQLLNWDITTNYTVTNFSTGGWTENANNTLSIQVRDSASGTPLTTAVQNFVVYVDNTDNSAPTATMNQLSSVDVKDYDEDNRAAWLGHVEPWNQSPWDNQDTGFNKANEYFGNDADVSGTVIFSGTASDDQRIQTILIWIDRNGDNIVDAGEEDDVAIFSGSGLIAQANTLGTWSASSQTLNASGHSVSWKFEWNSASATAGVSGIARNNIRIRARAIDFNLNPSTQLPALTTDTTSIAGAFNIMKVDVVPYITDITTGLENGTKVYIKRSATGAYTINQDDAINTQIRISGFNINPSASGIHIGSNNYTAGSSDTVNYTWANLNKSSITASGQVSLTTNSIDSQNNSNNDTIPQNTEPATYGPNYTDDRSMFVWDVLTTAWSGRTEAVMRANRDTSGNKTGTMDWLFVNNSQTLQFNGNALSNSWTLRGGDFNYNGSGTMMHIFLHDMNWSGGNDSYQVHGSVQWGKGTDNEGGAYNWHRANQDRLGIGNLSFNGDANYAYGDKVMTRYNNLRLLVSGTNTDTYNLVAYFDKSTLSRSIVFWSFHTGTGAGFTHTTTMDNDGGTWYTDLDKSTAGNTGADYNVTTNLIVGLRTPFNPISRTNVTSSGEDSIYFDLAYDSTRDNSYLVYFDEANSRLLLKWNNNPIASPSSWSSAELIENSAGQYVKAVVDANGRLHLAYYNSQDSTLKYSLITPTLDGSNNITSITITKQVTVDALFTNGMYNAITLRDFGSGDIRPVIVSYSITYGGTRNSLKISWPLVALASITDGATPSTGAFTGTWQVVSACTTNAPSQDYAFIETNGTGYTGNIIVGYNGTFIEQATLLSGLY